MYDDVLNRMLNSIPDSYAKSIGFPLHDLTAAFALEANEIYKKINEVEMKLDIENLTGDELTRRVYQLTGLKRREAVNATGIVTVKGTGHIPEGTIFATLNNVEFATSKSYDVIEESNVVEVIAVVPGPSGNVGAGSITKIPVKIPGILEVTNTEPTKNGYVEENDDELKYRFYNELRKPIVSGNKNHYEKWALEIAGVGSARCFPLANGPNTVEVCIIGNDGRAATLDLIKAVQNYIDPEIKGLGEGVAPAGAYCTITTAKEISINISADIVLAVGYTVEKIKKDVEEQIANLFKEQAFKTQYISVAQIGSIIFNTAGVLDYSNLKINDGTINIGLNDREIAVQGSVSLNDT